MTDCCNTTTDAPPPLPVVHYYCGGIGRAVCGEPLTLDKTGPCFSTHFPDTTCEACRRSTPALASAPSSSHGPVTRDLRTAAMDWLAERELYPTYTNETDVASLAVLLWRTAPASSPGPAPATTILEDLLAAAPDLYAALERVLPLAEKWANYVEGGSKTAAIVAAREALARADAGKEGP